MFEKVNPYLKQELNNEAAAHLCGCRCASGTGTVGGAIQSGLNGQTCFATCIGDTNRDANLNAAYNDRKW